MHHIHKLKKMSEAGPTLATQALDELIIGRLTSDANEEWLERACMLRLWIMITTGAETLVDTTALKKLLDDMFEIAGRPFSSKAAHAAQTVSNLMLSAGHALMLAVALAARRDKLQFKAVRNGRANMRMCPAHDIREVWGDQSRQNWAVCIASSSF